MKVLSKAAIFEKRSIVVVQAEVDTLARMQHPFIVHLFAVHQVSCIVASAYLTLPILCVLRYTSEKYRYLW